MVRTQSSLTASPTQGRVHSPEMIPQKHQAPNRPTSRLGAYFCSITLFIGPYLQLSSILVFFRVSRHGSCQKCILLFPQTVCLNLNTNFSWDRSCCSRELVWNRVLLSYRFPIAGSKPCCHVSPAHDAWLPFVSDWCLRPSAASLVLAPVHPRCSQRLIAS